MARAAGYSGKTLTEKLGLKAGLAAAVVDAPGDYRRLLGHVPAGVLFLPSSAGDLDFVHVFVRERTALHTALRDLRGRIRPQGMIWISWPKKPSRTETDVTEAVVRAEAIAVGLVDVKGCAIDETWSGLKLVIPVKDRK